jgi:CubicO group peptidase (beta-lactamase class C family)
MLTSASNRARTAVLASMAAIVSSSLVATGCRGERPPASAAVAPSVPPGVDDISALLQTIRARHELPGMAASVFSADRLLAVGAAGTRRVGSDVPLVYTDRLQMASIAKTMTATIVATLVDRGALAWHTTLGDLYPELVTSMPPAFRGVTVDQLLRHQAGFPQWMRHDDVVKAWVRKHERLSNPERRYEAVKHILGQRPEYTPGSRFGYTNDAYLVLGHICERVTNRSYEDLLQEEIFGWLGMRSVGLEEPWSDRSLNQPWGHVRQGRRFVPYEPDPEGYGGVSFGTPYGVGVNASVVDMAAYGRFHLRGDLGLESRLKAETFRRLHHAPPADVARAVQVPAAGFFNEGRVDVDGRWLNVQHWGYYARGRTLLWFSPQADVGAVVLTNGTDEDEAIGMRPISEIVIALFERYRSPARRQAK